MSPTLSHPLALAIITTCVLWLVHLAFTTSRQRKQRRVVEARRWFLAEGQFQDSNPAEMVMLYEYARERSCQGEVLAALERIRLAYGSPPKNGHLYWLRLQCDGRIPFTQMPPRCIPGQGVGDQPSGTNDAG